MELEQLRQSWKVHTDKQAEMVVSKSSIESILKKRAQESRNRIVRTLGFDAVLMLIVNVSFIGLLYYLEFSNRHLSSLILISATLFLLIHYHFNLLTLQRSSEGSSVKDSLIRNSRTLKRYLLSYKIGIPTLLSILSWIYTPGILEYFYPEVEYETIQMILFAGIIALGGFLFVSVLERLIYKKHIQTLQQLIEEIQN